MARYKALIFLLAAALSQDPARAQTRGYRFSGDEVVIDRVSLFQNWEFAPGTLEFSTSEVRPRRWRKDVNAVEDIVDFLRLHPPTHLGNKEEEEIAISDAIQAASNAAGVANILDGDLSTYWEPDPLPDGADLASRWWFTIDLGRFVFARKIVLRFVDGDVGDPFLLFDVLTSDGSKRLPTSPDPIFRRVLRTLQPNRSERVFEVDLTSSELSAVDMRFVQVIVTGTAGERGRQVTLEEYFALSANDRGAVDHLKILPGGTKVPVAESVWEQLDDERRGDVRYWQRERPRLAELEVWSQGDEIISGVLHRGGTFALNAAEQVNLGSFIDGDIRSNSNMLIQVFTNPGSLERHLTFDLASHFWIDSNSMAFGRELYTSVFGDYELEVSDGSRAPDGSLSWMPVRNRRQTFGYQAERNEFEPTVARFFRVSWTLIVRALTVVTLAEIQLYGQGFQPRVSLESDLIRLGGSRNLLDIAWEADAPPGTSVQIETRTGDDLVDELHYFRKDGTEVTEVAYGRLLSIFKGDIIAEQLPGPKWSPWSDAYSNPAGSRIVSPSPRQFLKVRATLISKDPEVAGSLKSVRVRFSPPVAHGLIGEIWPRTVETLGTRQTFSVYVRPSFQFGDTGFDELLLAAPADVELSFLGLYRGHGDELASNSQAATMLTAEVISERSDSMRVRFPALSREGLDGELLRLDFDASLFSSGSLLRVALQRSDGQEGDLWQWAEPGDALAQVEGNGMTVISDASQGQLLRSVVAIPRVITPNADGIGDEVTIKFSVVLVADDSPVSVEIHDLDGRLVQRLDESRSIASGRYQLRWNGRNHAGDLVPPGIYSIRVRVHTAVSGADVGENKFLTTIAVAY
ncbi:MAG: FlgD immunoglobulin-like domain containing protein [Candidatus Latescibacterota bacterium]|nr:FlgD immunoglobulin-like domain containing protein [Candidatus Latescibacterota bacterium]